MLGSGCQGTPFASLQQVLSVEGVVVNCLWSVFSKSYVTMSVTSIVHSVSRAVFVWSSFLSGLRLEVFFVQGNRRDLSLFSKMPGCR